MGNKLLMPVLAGCLAALPLFPMDAGADDRIIDEARGLFDEGLAHVEAGEYAEAATAFRAAYLIKPNWMVLYNIAEAELGAGNHSRALEAYTLYLVEGGEEIPPSRERHVRKTVARLGSMVGYLMVKCPVAGAVVLIDGRRQGITPLLGSALVNAGEHEVVVVKDDREIHRQRIRVDGGQLTWVVVDDTRGREYAATELVAPEEPELELEPEPELELEPEPEPEHEVEIIGPAPERPAAPAPADSAERTGATSRDVWARVMLGTGAAAAVAAVVVGSVALSGARSVERTCDGDRCPISELERAERVHNLAVATDVLIGASAATLVTGGILLLTGRGGEARRDAVVLAPAVRRGGGLLVVEAGF